MAGSPQDILQQFIEDEDSALTRNKQGAFYPDNHHRIKPLVPKAARLLARDKRTDFYFHLLRLNECPAVKTADEFELLLNAYARLTPMFIVNNQRCLLPRPKGLFLFGHDDHQTLTDEPAPSVDTFLGYLKFWRYADSFWHMPGMLKSQSKFLLLSQDSALLGRVSKVLHRVKLNIDLTLPTTLWFWSLMLLALQQESSAREATRWLLQAECCPSDRAFFVTNLARYLRAASRNELLLQVEDES